MANDATQEKTKMQNMQPSNDTINDTINDEISALLIDGEDALDDVDAEYLANLRSAREGDDIAMKAVVERLAERARFESDVTERGIGSKFDGLAERRQILTADEIEWADALTGSRIAQAVESAKIVLLKLGVDASDGEFNASFHIEECPLLIREVMTQAVRHFLEKRISRHVEALVSTTFTGSAVDGSVRIRAFWSTRSGGVDRIFLPATCRLRVESTAG